MSTLLTHCVHLHTQPFAVFVEALDREFHNVCELDLIFNAEMVYIYHSMLHYQKNSCCCHAVSHIMYLIGSQSSRRNRIRRHGSWNRHSDNCRFGDEIQGNTLLGLIVWRGYVSYIYSRGISINITLFALTDTIYIPSHQLKRAEKKSENETATKLNDPRMKRWCAELITEL
jgi:hypothetical protein